MPGLHLVELQLAGRVGRGRHDLGLEKVSGHEQTDGICTQGLAAVGHEIGEHGDDVEVVPDQGGHHLGEGLSGGGAHESVLPVLSSWIWEKSSTRCVTALATSSRLVPLANAWARIRAKASSG